MLVLQTFRLDAGLASGAFLPVVFGHLVPTDMNVLAWKELADFGQHVLQELEGFIFARAIDARENATFGVRRVRATGAAQLGISGQRRARVAGHFDLRHDSRSEEHTSE